VRGLARVPAERNAKGIALFALAELARVRSGEAQGEAKELLAVLVEMKLDGYNGAAGGYNFDWQSRNFFARKGSATIVPTAFAARALVEGLHDLQDFQDLQDVVRSVCEFILKDLPRTVENENEICFSYAPHTNTRIFNASLLAAEVLASVGRH